MLYWARERNVASVTTRHTHTVTISRIIYKAKKRVCVCVCVWDVLSAVFVYLELLFFFFLLFVYVRFFYNSVHFKRLSNAECVCESCDRWLRALFF